MPIRSHLQSFSNTEKEQQRPTLTQMCNAAPLFGKPAASPVHQELHTLSLAVASCVVQGRVLVGILQVDVGTRVNQQLGTLNLTIAHCTTHKQVCFQN